MTPAELKAQRIRAKANLELLEMNLRTGKSTPDQVQEARDVLEALREHRPGAEQQAAPVPTTSSRGPERLYLPQAERQLSPHVAALAEQVKREMEGIDRQKAVLSNRLKHVPDGVPCRDLTGQILALREEWQAKGDELRYVLEHGNLPDSQEPNPEIDRAVFVESLPTDKLDLDRKIRNEKANLSKYRTRLERSETEAKKAHYRTLVAQAEGRISLMQTHFNAL